MKDNISRTSWDIMVFLTNSTPCIVSAVGLLHSDQLEFQLNPPDEWRFGTFLGSKMLKEVKTAFEEENWLTEWKTYCQLISKQPDNLKPQIKRVSHQ